MRVTVVRSRLAYLVDWLPERCLAWQQRRHAMGLRLRCTWAVTGLMAGRIGMDMAGSILASESASEPRVAPRPALKPGRGQQANWRRPVSTRAFLELSLRPRKIQHTLILSL